MIKNGCHKCFWDFCVHPEELILKQPQLSENCQEKTDFKDTNNRNICGCCISGGTGCDQNAAISLYLFNVELNNFTLYLADIVNG